MSLLSVVVEGLCGGWSQLSVVVTGVCWPSPHANPEQQQELRVGSIAEQLDLKAPRIIESLRTRGGVHVSRAVSSFSLPFSSVADAFSLVLPLALVQWRMYRSSSATFLQQALP